MENFLVGNFWKMIMIYSFIHLLLMFFSFLLRFFLWENVYRLRETPKKAPIYRVYRVYVYILYTRLVLQES